MAYPCLFPTPVPYLCSREDSNGPSGETQAQRVDSSSFYPAGPSRAERPESSCWLKFLQERLQRLGELWDLEKDSD